MGSSTAAIPTLARPASAPEVTAGAVAFLDHLRAVFMSCRTKPHTTLFAACAALHANPAVAREAHAEALMRCLAEVLGKRPRLHAPGTVERSLDENWLIQLGLASRRNDLASLRFLLGSRIAYQHQRLVRFLIGEISNRFVMS
ncbi:hypothetical protein [Cognatishimia sp. F0-27]|uniref:hypothetical protein n=1 Tax=Cognatishimia sp. F0-27 TaxID=2816855 RepID=UPI001D0C61DC|nr:hypothetical protein [Cognatishimia sp. F0-27]MCC1493097.1 hypothetical protein [Cognatishimia sp. F0-27]